MRKYVSFAALTLLGLLHSQWLIARDVQLRPRADLENSTSTAVSTNQVDLSKLSDDERLQRLERIVNNQGLVDMLLRLDSLQNEIQALRGEMELHSHQLEEIKQRQRDLYVDIDRRLLQVERNGPGSIPVQPLSTDTPTQQTTDTPAISTGTVVTQKPGSVANADPAEEQKAYQAAFDLLRELRYEQAVKAFHKFLDVYPHGRYAHIAQYWVGEANYAQRKFAEAILDYKKLISEYPNSPKHAEAMLKIGYSQYELKQYSQAQTTLKTLMKEHPGTTEAGQAKNLIKKIRLNQAG